mmetsp:Transcript_39001/g.102310  ORF Transcript_39001/g.102310 Transcript_39001/m.102310 type:complete len:220 (+) Transcript_39001:89-748(+)
MQFPHEALGDASSIASLSPLVHSRVFDDEAFARVASPARDLLCDGGLFEMDDLRLNDAPPSLLADACVVDFQRSSPPGVMDLQDVPADRLVHHDVARAFSVGTQNMPRAKQRLEWSLSEQPQRRLRMCGACNCPSCSNGSVTGTSSFTSSAFATGENKSPVADARNPTPNTLRRPPPPRDVAPREAAESRCACCVCLRKEAKEQKESWRDGSPLVFRAD